MYRIVSPAGVTLALGFETRAEARRYVVSRRLPQISSVWDVAEIELDGAYVSHQEAEAVNIQTVTAARAATIRRAKRAANVRAVVSALILVGSALVGLAFIWGAIVGAVSIYDFFTGR